jgi:hypothetical protein
MHIRICFIYVRTVNCWFFLDIPYNFEFSLKRELSILHVIVFYLVLASLPPTHLDCSLLKYNKMLYLAMISQDDKKRCSISSLMIYLGRFDQLFNDDLVICLTFNERRTEIVLTMFQVVITVYITLCTAPILYPESRKISQVRPITLGRDCAAPN